MFRALSKYVTTNILIAMYETNTLMSAKRINWYLGYTLQTVYVTIKLMFGIQALLLYKLK